MADKKRGMFITFEGGEGTGKSTQVRMLCEAFAEAGITAIATREPGGTPEAERIRDLLVQRDGGDYDALTEALLLFAGRREHVVKKIIPALEKGEWVVSDRFADSTRAMQGDGMGLNKQVIENLYGMPEGDLKPDLASVLDIDPVEGLARSAQKTQSTQNKRVAQEDRYERMSVDFHRRLRQGFLNIAETDPQRCIVIDAAQTPEAVHKQVVDAVSQRLNVSLKAVKYG